MTTPTNLADLCADGKEMALFIEQAFSTPPEWFNYLPKPGSYESPRYGQVVITPERNANFVTNFKKAVYQEKLPIDCEHDLAQSGAVGWVTDMRVNADGSVDAKAEWNSRGTELIKDDRFKYFSPAFFDLWTDPVNPDKAIKDVASGGALTTRPFFKEKALRPLVASERGLSEMDTELENVKKQSSVLILNFTALRPVENSEGDDMADDKKKTGDEEPKAPTAQQFSELQTELSEAKAKLEAAEAKVAEKETALTASEESAKKFGERVTALEKAARESKFKEMAKDWVGKPETHVAMLEHLAMSEKGEDSELFKGYVENQSAASVQSKMFDEIGSAAPVEGSARAIIDGKAKAFRETDKSLTEEMAFDRAWEEAPADLRQAYREETSRVN